VPKFTAEDGRLIKSIVAALSIKRILDPEIIAEVKRQTDKKITRKTLYNVRQRIKKESYHWYPTMREPEYEYIHEFRQRVNEIISLQKRHHQIIDNNEHNPQIQQTSLAELHRLGITLSNLYDVAPTIIGVGANATISIISETKSSTAATTDNCQEEQDQDSEVSADITISVIVSVTYF
jgi:hypothetical protein